MIETGQATPDWFMRINKVSRPIIREMNSDAKMLGPCYPSHALPWGDDDDNWVRWNAILLAAGVERSMQPTFAHPGLSIQSYQAMLHPDSSPKMVIGACASLYHAEEGGRCRAVV